MPTVAIATAAAQLALAGNGSEVMLVQFAVVMTIAIVVTFGGFAAMAWAYNRGRR